MSGWMGGARVDGSVVWLNCTRQDRGTLHELTRIKFALLFWPWPKSSRNIYFFFHTSNIWITKYQNLIFARTIFLWYAMNGLDCHITSEYRTIWVIHVPYCLIFTTDFLHCVFGITGQKLAKLESIFFCQSSCLVLHLFPKYVQKI